jgi:hypothetical protein
MLHRLSPPSAVIFITKTPFDGILLLLADIMSQTTAARMIMRRIAKSTLYLFKMINMPYTPINSILYFYYWNIKKKYAEK